MAAATEFVHVTVPVFNVPDGGATTPIIIERRFAPTTPESVPVIAVAAVPPISPVGVSVEALLCHVNVPARLASAAIVKVGVVSVVVAPLLVDAETSGATAI